MSILLLITIAGCGGSGGDDGPSGDQSVQPETVVASPPSIAQQPSSPQLSSDPGRLVGSAGTIEEVIRPALENALQVELNLDDTFELTPAGGYTVVFSYEIEGDLPSGVDPVSAFAEVADGLGGSAGASVARRGYVTVSLEEISIGDVPFFMGLTLEGKELSATLSVKR